MINDACDTREMKICQKDFSCTVQVVTTWLLLVLLRGWMYMHVGVGEASELTAARKTGYEKEILCLGKPVRNVVIPTARYSN